MGVSRASTQAADGMWQITKFSELNMLTKTQGILQKEGWKEARPKGEPSEKPDVMRKTSLWRQELSWRRTESVIVGCSI